MKSDLLCVACILIFSAFRLLVLAEDAAADPPLSPPFSVSDNKSLDSSDDAKDSQSDDKIRELEPSADVSDSFNEKIISEQADSFKQVFVEATSQNSGVANDVPTTGHHVLVTLADVATAELQQRAILPSQNQNSQQTNRTEPSKADDFKPEVNQSRSEPTQQTDRIETATVKENLTEEIPSFSEWAQKQLEEAEKNKDVSNASAQHHQVNGKQTSGAKLRWKNYASLDCGAKVVASNPEAVSPSAILSPSRDEYKLNTCTSRIWFIVELCEAIQAKKIDFANFELFSSSPKDFVVSVSDRFPTREWSTVGQFAAKDERDIQSFDLLPHLFGKYIKVEVKSHYGSEHYCPISLFRVYGTSEFEVLQKEDPVHADRLEEDDDVDDLDLENGDARKNLFSSATDAVISMVKKAAEVLGNKGNYSNQTQPVSDTKVKMVPLVRVCTAPRHLVVCDNCSDALFGRVFELLSCDDVRVGSLVQTPLIWGALLESNICQKFGLEFHKPTTRDFRASYVEAMFSDRMLGAMCNLLGIAQNKIFLNVSTQYSNNTQPELPSGADKLINIETSEPHVVPVESKKDGEVTDALTLETTEAGRKATCSTDVMYTGQIKPTKTLTTDVHIGSGNTETGSIKQEAEAANTAEATQEQSGDKIGEVEESEHADKLLEVETTTESVESLEEQLAHLMDFNGESQHLPSTQTTSSTPQAQKESVFLRLSNRIKALERNMSLSSQYLEELSKRYKKQVEEIQKLLDKTILSMTEESKQKDERNKQLEERLLALTSTVEALAAERRSWSSTIYCIIVSSLVTLFITTFCCKTPEPVVTKKVETRRRKSVDFVPPHGILPKKRRRPSDQALKIVRSSMEASENAFKRKKKKKPVVLKRSNSIGTLGEERVEPQIWERQQSDPAATPFDWVEGKHVQEVPFVLEESEHSSLEPWSLEAEKVAPSFLKTALTSRSVRKMNGDAAGKASRKSVSVDESARNGNLNGAEVASPKKERKGFKRIFKKVF